MWQAPGCAFTAVYISQRSKKGGVGDGLIWNATVRLLCVWNFVDAQTDRLIQTKTLGAWHLRLTILLHRHAQDTTVILTLSQTNFLVYDGMSQHTCTSANAVSCLPMQDA